MTSFELYTLFLCLFVYVLFVALFSTLIFCLVRANLKLIRTGLEDERIKRDYERELKRGNHGERNCKILPVLCCVLLTIALVFSTYSGIAGDRRVGNIPTFKVVSSGSMSAKFEKNTYLFENKLDNQLQIFDLILLHKLPAEEDLKLYDVVVYEVDNVLLVHRIVGIEEPNEKHPNERQFLLQGDNVQYPDKFPVRYSQLKSIYRDQRIPNVGSFVFFMQSPAGVLCFLLTVCGVIAMFIVEKVLMRAIEERLAGMVFEPYVQEVEGKRGRKKKPPESEAARAPCAADAAVPGVRRGPEEVAAPPKLSDGGIVLPAEVAFIQSHALRAEDAGASRLIPSVADRCRFIRTADWREVLQRTDGCLTWLEEVVLALDAVLGVRVVREKRAVVYLCGYDPMARLAVTDKGVFVCLSVSPARYTGISEGITDVFNTKGFEAFPTCIALTSARQVEIIKIILKENFYT